MSHFVDIGSLKEKVFILNNLALSGELFSTSYFIGVSEFQKHYSDLDYHHFTKSIVSNYAIELAVKLRNASELLQENKISYINDKNILCYGAGKQAGSENEEHDLFYICNKIIHAKKFRIDTVGSAKYKVNFMWWNGYLTLAGTMAGKQQTPWEFFFSIQSWCESAIIFINSCETSLSTINMQSEDRAVYS
ncbi:MAG: hypothetical protein L3J24_12890 [Xanthomonadales bacterium]|nr:hypothetical protein [Xanthomonadales bacterium]